MNILFLLHAPKINASTRYRVYNYLPFLKDNNIKFKIVASYSVQLVRRMTQTIPEYISKYFNLGNTGLLLIRKISYYIYCFINIFIFIPYHFIVVLLSPLYDIIFIQSMIHPGIESPFLEKVLFKLNSNVIYDIDDALYTRSEINDKINYLLLNSRYIITSTDALAKHIKSYNNYVSVVTDPMDFSYYTQKIYKIKEPIVLGWIGHSRNFKYLSLIEDVLKYLANKYRIVVKIVSSNKYELKDVKIINKKWKIEDEIADLKSFDIGLNPMFDDEYEEAKNSLKLQQYLSIGLPAVTSPGGLSTNIYRDKENVLFARTDKEWLKNLVSLIKYPKKREYIGKNGRKTMQEWFSIDKASIHWFNIIKSCNKK